MSHAIDREQAIDVAERAICRTLDRPPRQQRQLAEQVVDAILALSQEPSVQEQQEAMRFGPRAYTPEQMAKIHEVVQHRQPLDAAPLPVADPGVQVTDQMALQVWRATNVGREPYPAEIETMRAALVAALPSESEPSVQEAESRREMPSRLAVDANGYVWRIYGEHWSMAVGNPDNKPIPVPVTFYEPSVQVTDEIAKKVWDELAARVPARAPFFWTDVRDALAAALSSEGKS